MKIAVVIFAYKRALHLSSLLGSLVANQCQKDFDFYIFIDGPIEEPDDLEIRKVIQVAQEYRKHLPNLVIRHEENNIGYRRQVEEKGDFIFGVYESAIFLEEDLIVSPNFLKVMQSLLARYQEIEKVGCVSGHYVPGNSRIVEHGLCELKDYGHNLAWGTWRNEWQQYRAFTVSNLKSLTKVSRFSLFNRRGAFPFSLKLAKEIFRDGRSWAIRWYAFFYLTKRKTVFPSLNLVIHVGTDSKATNYTFARRDPLLTHLDIESGDIETRILEAQGTLDVEQQFQRYLREAANFPWLTTLATKTVVFFQIHKFFDLAEARSIRNHVD